MKELSLEERNDVNYTPKQIDVSDLRSEVEKNSSNTNREMYLKIDFKSKGPYPNRFLILPKTVTVGDLLDIIHEEDFPVTIDKIEMTKDEYENIPEFDI